MILVVGATGVLGSSICRRLRERGHQVRALVRTESPAAQPLRDSGVELHVGDLRRPADLEAACRGVTTVFSTATAMGTKDKSLTLRAVDRDGQLALVDAAARNGVGHFVFVSVSPQLTARSPLIRYKREVERAVRASGMRWTILQPSVFMEIWLGPALGFDAVNARASIFGAGHAPLCWVSAEDVAAHAVASLEDPRLHNRDVPLGGPERIAPNDVVRIFERLSGRPFKVTHVPGALLSMMAPVVGIFNELAASGMRLGAEAALGDAIDSPIQRQLGLPLTSVEKYAERVIRGS